MHCHVTSVKTWVSDCAIFWSAIFLSFTVCQHPFGVGFANNLVGNGCQFIEVEFLAQRIFAPLLLNKIGYSEGIKLTWAKIVE